MNSVISKYDLFLKNKKIKSRVSIYEIAEEIWWYIADKNIENGTMKVVNDIVKKLLKDGNYKDLRLKEMEDF